MTEVDYYKINIPCLYDTNKKCIPEQRKYWDFLVDVLNNRKLTKKERKKILNKREVKYDYPCYRIDKRYTSILRDDITHFLYCRHGPSLLKNQTTFLITDE